MANVIKDRFWAFHAATSNVEDTMDTDTEVGGVTATEETTERGMVRVMSMWDDHDAPENPSNDVTATN